MKYFGIVVVLLLAVFIYTSYAVNCDAFSYGKTACEANSCYWCERCSNNQSNTFGQDKCVATSGECLHTCSVMCGSSCAANSDCKLNLTDDTCMYNAICSFCSCNYVTQ